MSDIHEIIEAIKRFRDDREWKQFHDHKSLAASVTIEAAELLEHFQWKSRKEADEYATEHKEEIGEEVADVLIYLIELADITGIDILESITKKLEKNTKKYPVEKSKGNAKKYTEL